MSKITFMKMKVMMMMMMVVTTMLAWTKVEGVSLLEEQHLRESRSPDYLLADEEDEEEEGFPQQDYPGDDADLEEFPPFQVEDLTKGKKPIKPWPNAIIPYTIIGNNKTKKKVLGSMNELEKKTCLKFTPHASEARYLVVKQDDGGCWTSSIGYPSTDGKIIIGLGRGCKSRKRILHELLHAAGFMHEHIRPDRGDYITVLWNNIKKKGRPNFKIDNRYSDLSIPYDFKSIMHYGRKAFAINKKQPTLEAKTDFQGTMGGSKLSPFDIQRIEVFYNC